jgi:hypothetical protein
MLLAWETSEKKIAVVGVIRSSITTGKSLRLYCNAEILFPQVQTVWLITPDTLTPGWIETETMTGEWVGTAIVQEITVQKHPLPMDVPKGIMALYRQIHLVHSIQFPGTNDEETPCDEPAP